MSKILEAIQKKIAEFEKKTGIDPAHVYLGAEEIRKFIRDPEGLDLLETWKIIIVDAETHLGVGV